MYLHSGVCFLNIKVSLSCTTPAEVSDPQQAEIKRERWWSKRQEAYRGCQGLDVDRWTVAVYSICLNNVVPFCNADCTECSDDALAVTSLRLQL